MIAVLGHWLGRLLASAKGGERKSFLNGYTQACEALQSGRLSEEALIQCASGAFSRTSMDKAFDHGVMTCVNERRTAAQELKILRDACDSLAAHACQNGWVQEDMDRLNALTVLVAQKSRAHRNIAQTQTTTQAAVTQQKGLRTSPERTPA